MGPFESACVDRVKSAKLALYGEHQAAKVVEPTKPVVVFDWHQPRQKKDEPVTEHGYVYRVTYPWEAWVLAMRGEDPIFRLECRIQEMANEKHLYVDDIIRETCRFYRTLRSEVRSTRRKRHIVRTRQVSMYLVKRLTSRSLPEIGRHLGGRDHTTVLHGIRKIEQLLRERPSLVHEINSVLDALEGQANG